LIAFAVLLKICERKGYTECREIVLFSHPLVGFHHVSRYIHALLRVDNRLTGINLPFRIFVNATRLI
jgi:hypothetical protein